MVCTFHSRAYWTTIFPSTNCMATCPPSMETAFQLRGRRHGELLSRNNINIWAVKFLIWVELISVVTSSIFINEKARVLFFATLIIPGTDQNVSRMAGGKIYYGPSLHCLGWSRTYSTAEGTDGNTREFDSRQCDTRLITAEWYWYILLST